MVIFKLLIRLIFHQHSPKLLETLLHIILQQIIERSPLFKLIISQTSIAPNFSQISSKIQPLLDAIRRYSSIIERWSRLYIGLIGKNEILDKKEPYINKNKHQLKKRPLTIFWQKTHVLRWKRHQLVNEIQTISLDIRTSKIKIKCSDNH